MLRARDRFVETARLRCQETQQQTLARLLRLNSDSDFSRRFQLNHFRTVADFQQRLPIADFDFFAPYIQQLQAGNHQALLGRRNRLLMFAITSGTTSASKSIPVTNHFLNDYRRGWQHWGITTQQQHPQLQHLRIVQLASSHRSSLAPDGTPCGSISGLVTSMQKFIVRRMYSVPSVVPGLQNPTAKRYAAVRFAYADPWVGMLVTANPSTLLQLSNFADLHAENLIRDIHDGTIGTAELSRSEVEQLSKFLQADPIRAAELERIVAENGSLEPRKCWKHLTCLAVWTGGSVKAYLPELRKRFGGLPLRDHGLHASEGRMTIPLEPDSASGVLDIESHFFEFVPDGIPVSDSTQTMLAHELRVGQDYNILMTTSSGLYRYNIRDIVRCTGFLGTTPLLEFLHKGSHISSITGEKISESQVVESVAAAMVELGQELRQFTLTPEWASPPLYRLFIETDAKAELTAERLIRISERVDHELRLRNTEYDEKRRSERLGGIECECLSPCDWQQWTSSRIAGSGGTPEQYKHPCLLPDPEFRGVFRKFLPPNH